MAASPSPQSSPMPPPQAPSPMGPPQQAPSPSAQTNPPMGTSQHHAHSPTSYSQTPPPSHLNGPAAMQQGTQTFQQASGQPQTQVGFQFSLFPIEDFVEGTPKLPPQHSLDMFTN